MTTEPTKPKPGTMVRITSRFHDAKYGRVVRLHMNDDDQTPGVWDGRIVVQTSTGNLTLEAGEYEIIEP